MSSRVPFEPGSTSVLVAVGAVAVTLATAWWWWGRPDGPTTASPRPLVSASALPAVTSSPPGSRVSPSGSAPASLVSVAGGSITVDVRGDVERPGPIELPAGSRVVDAVAAAGGATGRYGPVNLARVLSDGEQIRIGPDPGASAPPDSPPSPSASVPGGTPGDPGAAGLIDINSATATELEDLDGVGPVLAAAIVQWRTDNGPFTSVEDLLDVSGIGDATLDGMRHQISVG